MAFTDLDEHLAEAFGVEMEVLADRMHVGRRLPEKERRSPAGYARKLKSEHARRQARRTALLAAQSEPSSCMGPQCCNLLPVAILKGRRRSWYCCGTCGTRRRRMRARVTRPPWRQNQK